MASDLRSMRPALRALWIAAALAAGPTPSLAQESGQQSAADLQRIRAALERDPSPFQVPAPASGTLSYRVEVRAQLNELKPIEETPVDPTFGLPSIGQLLGTGLVKIHSAVVNYKHGRAKRRARSEVDEALASFCALRKCPAPQAGR